VIRAHDLVKTFGTVKAVDGVSFDVREGEIFAFLGPNGAGKTTTLSMIAGLVAADAGTVVIDGRPLGGDTDPIKRRFGLVPQDLALYDELSARENLRFFGALYDLTGRALDAAVARVLDTVGLADRATSKVKTFSGGMKRRLNLAIGLLHDPDILLLDEPTVGVDPQSRNKVFESIEALHREGRTIIYTTHYMEEAERLCDRIAIIDAGKLLALGTLSELIAAHGGPPTLIVKTNGSEQRLQTADPLAELNRIAAKTPIDAFQMERPTLEQVFLRLTGRSLRD
jgi:ABC-2 type transport system ATP-binding protein